MAPLQQLEPQARNPPTLQIQEEKNKKKRLSITLKTASNSLPQFGHFVISLLNGSNHKYTKNKNKLPERKVHHTP
jgi:hypothetical protein